MQNIHITDRMLLDLTEGEVAVLVRLSGARWMMTLSPRLAPQAVQQSRLKSA
jgi:hypothetical protein